jgi:tRNA threonylcarbamoyladenosine biosynthesis protein TsaE
MEQVITNSFDETKKLGQEFVKKILHAHDANSALVIALYGDLGAGKTTFVQGVAQGLDIQQRIISPTFIIVRKYDVSIKYQVSGIKYFYHIDLYRTESEKDLEGVGIKEILSDSEAVVFIEWAEKLGSLLPQKRWEVRLEHLEGDRRKISLKNK